MRKRLLAIVASLMLIPTPSYAAWMSGIVKNVQDRIVTIERANADIQEAYPKELQVKILENAKLKNIAALSDLKSGNEIKLDVRANKEQGVWDANYIELVDADSNAPTQTTHTTTVVTTP
jgi:hypothetical protein